MITFGICAYNEERSIEKTISSIISQVGPKDELLIVASGCTDKTVTIISSIQDTRIRLIVESVRSGKANATNMLVAQAKGSIIVYCDADVVIDKHAVSKLLQHFANPVVWAVSGRMIIQAHATLFDRICRFSRDALHKEKLKEQRAHHFWALNGYLFAFRKNRYIPLPSSNLVEDALLGWLMYQNGGTIVYEPQAIVYEKAPQTIRDYVNQKIRIRVGWFQMNRDYRMPIANTRNIGHLLYLFTSPYAWAYCVLELFTWLSARQRILQGNLTWPHVTSSKM